MYWLKGFLASIELRGTGVDSSDLETIIRALEHSIKAEQDKK
jgi:hypothetical protein